MKKTTIVFLLVLTIILSGCTVMKFGDQTSELNTLQNLGLVYSEGAYTMNSVYVSGFITTNQTVIRLGIPLGKRLIEGQKVTVSAATGAYLRTADGKYILEEKADLTPYIDGATIRNDGAILFVLFKNPDKWKGSDGKNITNNTPITGTINIEFSIS